MARNCLSLVSVFLSCIEGLLLVEHPGLIRIFLGRVCRPGEEVRDEKAKKFRVRMRK